MKDQQYTQAHSDHTMFYKHSLNGKLAILIVYVDDIVMTGDDEAELSKLIRFLAQQFEVKDLGKVSKAGWEIDPNHKLTTTNDDEDPADKEKVSKAGWEIDLLGSHTARHCICSEPCKSTHAQSIQESFRGCVSHSTLHQRKSGKMSFIQEG